MPSAPLPHNEGELARERVAATIVSVDFVVFLILLATLALSSSLTLLTEATRAGGVLLMEIVSVATLRAVHRRRFAAWGYGVGKVEALCNLMGCTGLVVGGLWISEKILSVLGDSGDQLVPVELAWAAVATAVATAAHGLALVAMKAVWTDGTSAIFIGQFRARRAKFWASASALVAVTLAALAYDPALRALFDSLGAAIGAAVMIFTGVTLGARCLAALIDIDVPGDLRRRIEDVLGSVDNGGLDALSLKIRSSGSYAMAEIVLRPGAQDDLASLRRRARSIEEALSRAFGETLDVSVIIRAEMQPPARVNP